MWDATAAHAAATNRHDPTRKFVMDETPGLSGGSLPHPRFRRAVELRFDLFVLPSTADTSRPLSASHGGDLFDPFPIRRQDGGRDPLFSRSVFQRCVAQVPPA